MSNDAYTDLLNNLLPAGPAWNRTRGSRELLDHWLRVKGTPRDVYGRPEGWTDFQLMLDGFGSELAVLDARLKDLIVESNPQTAQETLKARYREAGLPNPCAGEATEAEQMRREILLQWRALGGCTPTYIEEVAVRMGEAARVTEYPPFRVDESAVEAPVFGIRWAYAFNVALVDPGLHYFTVSEDSVGSPLLDWDQNNPLLCFLRVICPAHTVPTVTIVENAEGLPA